MSKTTILSLVSAVGWHAIYDNRDGTIFTAPIAAFAAVREVSEYGACDSVVPVSPADGYWFPSDEDNLLAVCHESELAATSNEWAAKTLAQFERKARDGGGTL